MATHALTIDPDQQVLLERRARGELRSPEVLVREAIDAYLKLYPGGLTEAEADEVEAIWNEYDGPVLTDAEWLNEARAAAEQYDRTGLHVTNDEVGEWIERLRTNPDAKLPPCHT